MSYLPVISDLTHEANRICDSFHKVTYFSHMCVICNWLQADAGLVGAHGERNHSSRQIWVKDSQKKVSSDKSTVKKTNKSGHIFQWRYSPGAETLKAYSFSKVPTTLFVLPLSAENSTSTEVWLSTLCVKMIKSFSEVWKEERNAITDNGYFKIHVKCINVHTFKYIIYDLFKNLTTN